MKRTLSILALVTALVVLASVANAVTTDWWITKTSDATNTRISSLEVGNIGDADATFDLSVWYSTDIPESQIFNVHMFLGFGTINKQKDVATPPADLKFSASAVSGLNLSFLYSSSGAFGGAWANSTTADRPYGVRIATARLPGGTSLPGSAKLFDISFTNTGLLAGESYAMKLYSFGAGTQGWQNYVQYKTGSTNLYAYGTTSDFLVTAKSPVVPSVPEPSSMIVLGSGALGLLGFLRRRRS